MTGPAAALIAALLAALLVPVAAAAASFEPPAGCVPLDARKINPTGVQACVIRVAEGHVIVAALRETRAPLEADELATAGSMDDPFLRQAMTTRKVLDAARAMRRGLARGASFTGGIFPAEGARDRPRDMVCRRIDFTREAAAQDGAATRVEGHALICGRVEGAAVTLHALEVTERRVPARGHRARPEFPALARGVLGSLSFDGAGGVD